MAQNPENLEPVPLTVQMEEFLTHEPSDYDDSTVAYCNRGLQLGIAHSLEVMSRQYPEEEARIRESLGSIADIYVPFRPLDTDVTLTNITFSKGEEYLGEYPLTAIPYTVAQVRSALLHPKYIQAFMYRRKKGNEVKLPHLTDRYSDIQKITSFSSDSPPMQIIAIAQYIQAPKIYAVDATKKFVERRLDFAGITEADKLDTYFDSLEEQVRFVKNHTVYIREAYKAIKQTTTRGHLQEQQVETLLDLAFLRKGGLPSEDDFASIFRSLATFVSRDEWDEAYMHRDFLLQYFGNLFPKWRREKYQEKSQAPTYNSPRDIAQAIANDQLQFDSDTIPPAYRNVLDKYFDVPRKQKKEQKQPEISAQPAQTDKQQIVFPTPEPVLSQSDQIAEVVAAIQEETQKTTISTEMTPATIQREVEDRLPDASSLPEMIRKIWRDIKTNVKKLLR